MPEPEIRSLQAVVERGFTWHDLVFLGELKDVTPAAALLGFYVPVAVTAELAHVIHHSARKLDVPDDEMTRIVLRRLGLAIYAHPHNCTYTFNAPHIHHVMRAHVSPDPAIHISL